LTWDDVEHLSDVLADHMHGPAVARAALVLDIDDDLDPRQMGGKALRRLALAAHLLVGGRFSLDELQLVAP
jgi:hypothetical protein